ncbi:MerR family DNA-binding transcriptional regulator [Pseudonocardia sp. DLS-67]
MLLCLPQRLTWSDLPTYGRAVSAERLLTTGEVARELGLSARSIARWAQEGKLTPALYTPGGHPRWRLGDVEEELRRLRRRAE